MRSSSLLLITVVALGFSGPAIAAPDALPLEVTVCGVLEPVAFWMWQNLAGAPRNPIGRADDSFVDVTLATRDGRTLRGYRFPARQDSRKGYLLFAQGNGMLASVIGELLLFRDAGLDVYVYDFRGYGRSQGRSRLRAIVDDYRLLIEALASMPEYAAKKRYLYGVSFGGLVLLSAAARSNTPFDALVVDSAPARASDLGCATTEYDPVTNLPKDSSRILVVSGSEDRVIKPSLIEDLSKSAKSRGGQANVLSGFPHPFMEASRDMLRTRLDLVLKFLLDH